ncbi:MAG TPA: RidA family protein [Acidimicrobiales bacterium]
MEETSGTARISSGSPFEPTIGFSRALRVGDRVLVSGTGPVFPEGEPCPDDAGLQARRCFAIIEAALDAAGASMEHIVRTRMYVTSAAHAEAVGAVHGELLGHVRPVATMVVVAGLLDPAWKVEVEAESVVPEGRRAPS